MASSEQTGRKPGFTDYLSILWKWKRFILSGFTFFLTAGLLLAFLWPVTYKSTSVIFIPPESSSSLGGLTSLLGSKSTVSLGAKLLGGSDASSDMLFGILGSRTTLTHVVRKFNLMEYYKIKEGNMDKCLKAFVGDISFDNNEHEMIEISVINESAQAAADIANYFVYLVDSINISINSRQAHNNRTFIEKRYEKNLADLRAAEDNMQKFQQKNGVFAVPQQLEVAIKAAAELEAELMSKEIASYFVKQQYGENSPQYMGYALEIKMLKEKVNELKNADKLTSQSNVLFPFKNVPEMGIEYLRLYREVEIQTKIMEFVLPLYEQAKVDEQKSIPSIMVLDQAVPAQLKYGPKRLFMVLGFFALALFLLVPMAFRMEKLQNQSELNLIEQKEKGLYGFLHAVLRIKK